MILLKWIFVLRKIKNRQTDVRLFSYISIFEWNVSLLCLECSAFSLISRRHISFREKSQSEQEKNIVFLDWMSLRPWAGILQWLTSRFLFSLSSKY